MRLLVCVCDYPLRRGSRGPAHVGIMGSDALQGLRAGLRGCAPRRRLRLRAALKRVCVCVCVCVCERERAWLWSQ